MKEIRFKKITADEIKKAYDYQQSVGWTFNNEMEVLGSTINNRFNFLLVAYSLFMNAYFMVKDRNDKITILVIGLIITFLLSIVIFRSHTRFTILFNILRSIDDRNVLPFIYKEYETKKIFRFFSHNTITGFIVPMVMLLSIIVGIIFNLLVST
jgi:hypothetical protein